ncbi:MAG: ATP-binding protein [Syntrophales bacterium]|nr:ATP-binding protein [Syntrophales bacterium]
MVETFILAAVSFTIATASLFFRGREVSHLTFSAACFALFVLKLGQFVRTLSEAAFWQFLVVWGLLALPITVILFTASLVRVPNLVKERHLWIAAGMNVACGVVLLTPIGPQYGLSILYIFIAVTLIYCYYILFRALKFKTGLERAKLLYIVVAVGIMATFGFLDFIRYMGAYEFPPLSNIFLAILVYFIYGIITHPQLMELKEFLARMSVKVILTFAITIILYLVLKLFSATEFSPFTIILLASFLIILAFEPTKHLLKITLDKLFPGNRDIFNFISPMDRKLEEEKSAMLEEMAPVLAHEIRTPLGSIKAAAQYLRSESLQEEESRLLDVIIEETNRLNGVVTQFLDFAKPYHLNLKKQDINEVIEKALTIATISGIPEKVKIEKDLRPDVPLVCIDAEQIIQVILNMITNALDAMPDGGTLTIRTRRVSTETGAAVSISIRDTGLGIKKEDLKNIFKPFFTTRERGVGLGLAICNKIVRNHGGTIRVKSIPGQGSIFHIRLNEAM